eukprot:TRINITY_DN275_c0_g1_i1.p1 TRINITY_DN275_c0_g1~~TRINITY_DN275_c0_g1_i1.p1  ORF type:complete len:1527 (-),score=446.86 TRINITY_DN275_c0_g1_i1:1816-6039(-)
MKRHILLSFNDAKFVVAKWNTRSHALDTVALHFCEDPDLRRGRKTFSSKPTLSVDPEGRSFCSIIYDEFLAVFPFSFGSFDDVFGSAVLDDDTSDNKQPVPSRHLVDLTMYGIRHVRALCYLHGYADPTVLVLHERDPTWSGRLSERKDTCVLSALSLRHRRDGKVEPLVIWEVKDLPFDCHDVVAVPNPTGGALLVAANSLAYINQRVVCGIRLNRFCDSPAIPNILANNPVSLPASHVVALSQEYACLVAEDGVLYAITLHKEGHSIHRLSIEAKTSTVPPSSLVLIDPGYLLIASEESSTMLLEFTIAESKKSQKSQASKRRSTSSSFAFDFAQLGDPNLGGAGSIGSVRKSRKLSSGQESASALGTNASAPTFGMEELFGMSISSSLELFATPEISFSVVDTLPYHGKMKDFVALGNSDFDFAAGYSRGRTGFICLLNKYLRLQKIASEPGWDLTSRVFASRTTDKFFVSSLDLSAPSLRMFSSGREIQELPEDSSPALIRDQVTLLMSELRLRKDAGVRNRQCWLQVTAFGMYVHEGSLKRNILTFPFDTTIQHAVCLEKNTTMRGDEGDRASFLACTAILDVLGCIHFFTVTGPVEALVGKKIASFVHKGLHFTALGADESGARFWACDAAGAVHVFEIKGSSFEVQHWKAHGLAYGLRQMVCEHVEEDTVLEFGSEEIGSMVITMGNGAGEEVSDTFLQHERIFEERKDEEEEGRDEEQEGEEGNTAASWLKETAEEQRRMIPQEFFVADIGISWVSKEMGCLIIRQRNGDPLFYRVHFESKPTKYTLRRLFVPRTPIESFTENIGFGSIATFQDLHGNQGMFMAPGLWVVLEEHGRIFVHEDLNNDLLTCVPFPQFSHAHGAFVGISAAGELSVRVLPPRVHLDGPLPFDRISTRRTPRIVAWSPDLRVLAFASSWRVPVKRSEIWENDKPSGNASHQPPGGGYRRDDFGGNVDPEVAKRHREEEEGLDDGYPPYEEERFELTVCAQRPDGRWTVVGKHAFERHEVCLAMTFAQVDGRREFLVAGTGRFIRDEEINADQPVRGWVYVFEATQSHFASFGAPNEVAAGGITCLNEIRGKLLVNAGRKLYLMEMDWNTSKLEICGFIDCGYFMTSASVVKDFIWIADAGGGNRLLRWHEKGQILSFLAADSIPMNSTAVGCLIFRKQLGLLASDDEGNTYIFLFEPREHDQSLHCVSAFRLGCNIVRFISVSDDLILYGGDDGSIGYMLPVHEMTFKRLLTISRMLTRHVPQTCGLHPRALRMIQTSNIIRKENEPQKRSTLDVDFIQGIWNLDASERRDIARISATNTDLVLENIVSFERRLREIISESVGEKVSRIRLDIRQIEPLLPAPVEPDSVIPETEDVDLPSASMGVMDEEETEAVPTQFAVASTDRKSGITPL